MRSNVQYPLGGITAPVISPRGFSLRRLLFSASEPGFIFDPTDITTLYQDRAGTTPVTAAGQSVGLRLDKSKGLALGPELVTNGTFTTDIAGWTQTGSGSAVWDASGAIACSDVGGADCNVAGAITTVIGRQYKVSWTVRSSNGLWLVRIRNSADFQYVGFGTGTYSGVFASSAVLNTVNLLAADTNSTTVFDNISVRELAGNHEVAVNDAKRGVYGWMPKTGRRNLLNATETLATQSVTVTAAAHTLAFTGTGTVTLSGASVAGPLVGTGASNRVTLTFTPTAGSLTLTVTGSVTLAQLQIGSVDTAYQRVVSQYDVTEAGIPTCYYVQADGVDDAYVTPTITPNTDKVQVFAGVRKNSDAVQGLFCEFSENTNANLGSFRMTVPGSAGSASYAFLSKGTAQSVILSDGWASPISNVVTGIGDISNDVLTIRVNGTAGNSPTNQGTGNYLAYPTYIYARGGTTLPFNGYDFGHAVRFGPNLDAATIARVEALIARNTPEVAL